MKNGINTSYFSSRDEFGNRNIYFSIFVEVEAKHNLDKIFSTIIVAISAFLLLECVILTATFFIIKQFRNVTNLFVLSNTFVAVPLLAFSIYMLQAAYDGQWLSGATSCKYAPFAILLSAFVLVWVNAAIAIDRHRQIATSAKKQLQVTSATFVLILIWLVGSVLFSPYIFVYNILEVQVGKNRYKICTRDVSSFVSILTAFTIANIFIIPLTVILISYRRLYKEIQRVDTQLKQYKEVCKAPTPIVASTSAQAALVDQQVKRNKRSKRLWKVLMAMVTLFAVMWLPLTFLFGAVTIDTILESYLLKSYQIVCGVCMMLLNAFITPIFYVYSDTNTRKVLISKCFPMKAVSPDNTGRS
ncbi:neuropeptide Y receptor type 2-like [Watersipora subatra]|uniref:neuropeptide Y receptor type 2-like n=1 Tax=Watersipora subatra TaxID=2589382 RepID=UPI00355AD35E